MRARRKRHRKRQRITTPFSTVGKRLHVLCDPHSCFLHPIVQGDCLPVRLSSHGITIGFTGDPTRPIVDANGIPISMWVAWFSPSDSLSRMTAHDASFETTELMPNFLKKPSSCAMTIGE